MMAGDGEGQGAGRGGALVERRQQHPVGDLTDDVGAGHRHRAVEAAARDGEGEHPRLLDDRRGRRAGARAARRRLGGGPQVSSAGTVGRRGSDATCSLGLLTDVAGARRGSRWVPPSVTSGIRRCPSSTASDARARRPARRARPGRPHLLRGLDDRPPGRAPRRPRPPARRDARLRARGDRSRAARLAAWAHRPRSRRAGDALRGGRRPRPVGPAAVVAAGLAAGRPASTCTEFAIHHEDVRRAQPGWAPRTLPADGPGRALDRRRPLRPPAAPAPAGVVLRRTDVARRGEAHRRGRPHRRGRADGAAAVGRRPPGRRPRHRQLTREACADG